jgi:site-specific DNA-methyltransferase (adenine-specific)
MKINNVYVGDNIEVLKTFPDNSIDSVVTDPPYGLGKEPNAIEVLQSWITTGYHEVKGKGFMGKEWDAFVPQPNFWKEIYRVLKPGGYVLSFAGTRTYDWMVMAVRLAGFEIRDMIAWLYGSGFPKSHDISKAIDKMMGAERKVIGKAKGAGSTGVNDRGNQTFIAKNGNDDGTYNITQATTNEAKQWQGWGTSLKPALEPIVMARKPLDGTVAQNVLKHGVGGINIDGCRVPFEDTNNPATNPLYRQQNKDKYKQVKGGELSNGAVPFTSGKNGVQEQGRFPANVIHDGSDEVVSLFPIDSGGSERSGFPGGKTFGGGDMKKEVIGHWFGDSGSASRFFYCAKASKEERNFGLYDFEDVEVRGGGGRVEKGYDENNEEDMRLKESARKFGAVKAKKKNIHPTVKPIDLMRYLVRLVTPPNGICLDPYLGSGTTAIACEMEKFSWIGIELVPEYAEIAKARIGAVKDYESTLDTKTIITESIKEDKEKELGIMNIFDFMEE